MPSQPADIATRNARVEANLGLVGAYVRRLRHVVPSCLYDDCMQEGYRGLIRAATLYDPARGTRFSTLAWYWIRSYVGSFLRRRRAWRTLTTEQLEMRSVCPDSRQPGAEERLRQERLDAVSHEISRLRSEDRYIVERTAQGFTLAEIGREVGLSEERVRQKKQRGLSRVRTRLAEKGILPPGQDEYREAAS